MSKIVSMKTKRILFLYRMNLSIIQQVLLFLADSLILLASLASVFVLIYKFGFDNIILDKHQFDTTYIYILFSFFIGITLRYIVKFNDIVQEKMLYIDLSIYLLLFAVLSSQWFFKEAIAQSLPFLTFLNDTWYDYTLMILLSVIHLSRLGFTIMQSHIRPSLLFTFSFLFVILVGTGLLMLPNATIHQIKFIDALFISTTSVCVTGLTTVDPSSTFTQTGFIIIMILIQIGGIGVMTFTSFFALSFMGKSSFNSQLMLKNLLNEDRFSNLFKVVLSIIFVTFIIESIGAYLIYLQVKGIFPDNPGREIFFSVFHSISAFCNAGISTLNDNLGDSLIVHNYSFQFWIAILIIIGGLGFPIVFNYMRLVHHLFRNGIDIVFKKQKHYIHRPHIINVYTYIAVLSTLFLLITGTVIYYFAEEHNTLEGLPFMGKLSASFFGSVTPRTAGFSIVDMKALTSTTLLTTFILMIIGASPMSTGGGMKTTTVFIALRTTWNVMCNKDRLDISGREIMPQNIRRAFAIIMLYLIWMCLAIMILSYTEKDVPLFTLFFEVASALSTVGLSIDFTSHLTSFGKIIIILSMYIGRIGVLTFFAGFLKESHEKNYTYPQENILM